MRSLRVITIRPVSKSGLNFSNILQLLLMIKRKKKHGPYGLRSLRRQLLIIRLHADAQQLLCSVFTRLRLLFF